MYIVIGKESGYPDSPKDPVVRCRTRAEARRYKRASEYVNRLRGVDAVFRVYRLGEEVR